MPSSPDCRLETRYNSIGPEEASIIAGGLAANSELRLVNLRNNDISDMGAEAIALSLTSHR
eukprot:5231455-Alexandrium_andersonii.AAC.1